MNLCGETLREINMFMEYFFFKWARKYILFWNRKRKPCPIPMSRRHTNANEIPLFITRFREMARFSILQHDFPFSWSICMELSIFSETRLEIGQWMILFLQNSDVYGHYTHKQRGINTKGQENQCGEAEEPSWTYNCFSAIWTNAWYMGHNWTLSN